MKKHVLTGLLAALACTLLALCVLVFLLSDRKAPEIRFSGEEIFYGEGQDTTILLNGVEAIDDRDGAVEVYVESIYPLENNRAKVYYAAADQAGNVAKASQVVHYGEKEGGQPPSDEPEQPGGEEPETPSGGQPSSEEPSSEATPDTPAAPGGPVITLKSDTAELNRGTRFQYAKYIQEITDDKDDQDTLYRRININGAYDVNTPGTYVLEYVVFDSDGNKSNPAKLTLIVK